MCNACGNANCIGTCCQVKGIVNCGGAAANNGIILHSPSYLTYDTKLHNFLEVIADKTDTEACIAFIDQQRRAELDYKLELERLKQLHKETLEKNEKDFLAKCLKYRPTITPELMSRFKGLKVFY